MWPRQREGEALTGTSSGARWHVEPRHRAGRDGDARREDADLALRAGAVEAGRDVAAAVDRGDAQLDAMAEVERAAQEPEVAALGDRAGGGDLYRPRYHVR